MRIPSADEIFGWRLPDVVPTKAPRRGNDYVAQGLSDLSGGVMNIADKQFGREERRRVKTENAQLQALTMAHEAALEDEKKGILLDASIPDEAKYKALEGKGTELARAKLAGLPPEVAEQFAAGHAELMLRSKKQFNAFEVQQVETARRQKEQAELQAGIVQYKNDVARTLDDILADTEIRDEDKMNKFREQADKIKGEWGEKLGSDKAVLLEPVHSDAIADAERGYRKYQKQVYLDTARASGAATVEELVRRAATGPQGMKEASALFNQIDLYGYSEQEKQGMKQQFLETITLNEASRRINAGDYNGLLKDLKNKDYLPDMDPHVRVGVIAKVQTDIEQEKRRQIAEAKAATAERKANLRDLLDVYEQKKLAGLPIDLKDEVNIARALKEFPLLAEKYKGIKEKGESFAFRSEQFAKDPLTFGAAVLGYQIKPLSMTDPNVLAQQLTARLEVGKRIKTMRLIEEIRPGERMTDNNMSYTPVLTTEEATGLSALLKTQKDGGVQLIGSLQKIVGQSGMAGIAQQIADKDSQSAMMIGLTAAGKTATAKTISEGQRLLREKAVKLPKDADLRGLFDGMIGDGMLGQPQNQEAHFKAFQSFYAAESGRQGDTLGEDIDKTRAEQAFKAIVGDIANIHSKKVVLPEGYSEDRFKNSVRKIDKAFVSALSGGGVQGFTNEDAAEIIRDDARWHVTNRPNIYRVEVDGRYLMTKGGSLVEVMFK